MVSFTAFPIFGLIALFIISAGLITLSGIRLARVAEEIALVTGLGQAFVGAVFVGISTSLSGAVLSLYSAAQSHPSLAISNSIGGIAAQTVFLAIADLTYRKVNLEHAAASLENLAQGALLLILLPIPLVAMVSNDWTLFGIHPASVILIFAYLGGLMVVKATKSDPMWKPRLTHDTQVEKRSSSGPPGASVRLFFEFSVLAFLLAGTGLILAEVALELSKRTHISESVMGGLFTSVATSLPELVTTLAAVKRGALNLAVGDIIGGNSFDVLFLAGSDAFFSNGSLYHQFKKNHIQLISISILMTGILMLGMLRREKKGPAGIGFESILVLTLYGVLAFMMFG